MFSLESPWVLISLVLAALAVSALVITLLILRYLKRVRIEIRVPEVIRETFPDREIAKKLRSRGEFHPSLNWRTDMQKLIHSFETAGVQGIYFIHGTFLGSDPFELVHIIKSIFPNVFSHKLQDKVHTLIKSQSNKLLKDTANFSPDYIDLFTSLCSVEMNINNFLWSSGNHHMARIRGALDLFDSLYQTYNTKNVNRFLLIAHSHGGQLLGLISRFLNDPSWTKDLLTIVWDPEEFPVKYPLLSRKRDALVKCQFDLVTLGSPYRYPYVLSKQTQLLHILNHRVDEFRPYAAQGILYTEDGDYPHKWGVSGSDFLSPLHKERDKNKRLDELLDIGIDVRNLKKTIESQDYIAKLGTTLLIDYCDNATDLKPNCIHTVFGHGIYTSKYAMEHLFSKISSHFYT